MTSVPATSSFSTFFVVGDAALRPGTALNRCGREHLRLAHANEPPPVDTWKPFTRQDAWSAFRSGNVEAQLRTLGFFSPLTTLLESVCGTQCPLPAPRGSERTAMTVLHDNGLLGVTLNVLTRNPADTLAQRVDGETAEESALVFAIKQGVALIPGIVTVALRCIAAASLGIAFGACNACRYGWRAWTAQQMLEDARRNDSSHFLGMGRPLFARAWQLDNNASAALPSLHVSLQRLHRRKGAPRWDQSATTASRQLGQLSHKAQILAEDVQVALESHDAEQNGLPTWHSAQARIGIERLHDLAAVLSLIARAGRHQASALRDGRLPSEEVNGEVLAAVRQALDILRGL